MTRNEKRDHDSTESITTEGRYGEYRTEDGLVVYDTENVDAWIQSDTTVDVTEAA